MENVREKLAENIHELWAMGKIEQGWQYDEVRPAKIEQGWQYDEVRPAKIEQGWQCDEVRPAKTFKYIVLYLVLFFFALCENTSISILCLQYLGIIII